PGLEMKLQMFKTYRFIPLYATLPILLALALAAVGFIWKKTKTSSEEQGLSSESDTEVIKIGILRYLTWQIH
ncbi:uncharacterized protein DAT39_003714, partial [Clarias magur]